jgi:anti-sigma factor RsiW
MSAESASVSDEFTCRIALELLMDYLDGVLSPTSMAAMDRHLAVCPSCRNYLASYVETVRLTKAELGKGELGKSDAPPEPLPPELFDCIRKALRADD